MSLNIKNPATVALADELARRRGISKTGAIHEALRDRVQSMGPAALNFADCVSHALSKRSKEPLLFVGDDFSKTDVTAA